MTSFTIAIAIAHNHNELDGNYAMINTKTDTAYQRHQNGPPTLPLLPHLGVQT